MNHVLSRLAVAGLLAASLTGFSAGVETAQAMPIAAAPVADALSPTTVQYMEGYRRHHGYRHHYRYTRRFHGYQGRAGLYNCGVNIHRTHLARKSCY